MNIHGKIPAIEFFHKKIISISTSSQVRQHNCSLFSEFVAKLRMKSDFTRDQNRYGHQLPNPVWVGELKIIVLETVSGRN